MTNKLIYVIILVIITHIRIEGRDIMARKQHTFVIETDLHTIIKTLAAIKRTNISDEVEAALTEYLQSQEKEFNLKDYGWTDALKSDALKRNIKCQKINIYNHHRIIILMKIT